MSAWNLIVLAIVLKMHLVSTSTWTPQGLLTQTVNDGVVAGAHANQYLKFRDNNGIRFSNIPNFVPTTSSSQFSFLAWFMLDQYPWDKGEDFDIVYINGKLRCMITASKRVECLDSLRFTPIAENAGDVFQFDITQEQILLGEWYLLALTVINEDATLRVYHQTFQAEREGVFANGPIASKTANFRPFGISAATEGNQVIFVGVHENLQRNGFVGSIRQVQFLKRHLPTDQRVKNAAFSYLLSTDEVYFQVTMFNTTKGITDSVTTFRGELVGNSVAFGGIQPQLDFKPQFMCHDWPEEQALPWYAFDQPLDFQLRDYSMRSDVYSDRGQNGDYRTTFQAWVHRSTDAALPRVQEILFEHRNVWRMVFETSSYDKVTIYNFQTKDLEVTFPRGRWVFVAYAHNEDDFQIHIEDEFGTVYSDGTQKRLYNSDSSHYITNVQVTIARGLSGYIQGVKYYKGILPDLRPYQFEPIEEGTNVLFYFRFNQDGLLEQHDQYFKNWVQGRTGFLYGLQSSGTKQIGIVLTKKDQKIYYHSSIDYNIDWDGISCTDGSKRLFFEKGSGYSLSSFQFMRQNGNDYITNIGEQHTSMTVELWFRPTEFKRGSDNYILFALKKNDRPILTIMQLGNELYCLPFYGHFGDDKNYGLHFLDYANEVNEVDTWHHISCTVDSDNRVLSGTLYQQMRDGDHADYGYIKQTASFSRTFSIRQDFPWDNFQVQLNGDLGDVSGMEKTFYADVRVWKGARSLEQIKLNRQILLDYRQEFNNLISSVQYLGGGYSGFLEPDLGQLRPAYLNIEQDRKGLSPIGYFVEFSGEEWKLDIDFSHNIHKRLLLCPMSTYVNWKGTSCSKQGVIEVKVFILKDQKSGTFEITAAHSIVQNSKVTNQIDQLFDFEWKLGLAQLQGDPDYQQASISSFSSQSRNSKLSFKTSDLQNMAAYQFFLRVLDKQFRLLGPQTLEYWHQSSDCVEFYDQEEETTVISRSVSIEKGTDDIYLYYVLKGCDKSPTSSVTLSYTFLDEQYELKPPFGYSFEPQKSRFIITKQAQQSLPINKEIKIALNARWNSRLQLSIIYKICFITKVDVQLIPNYYIVPKGEDLRIYTSQTRVINHHGSVDSHSYSLSWNCPTNELCNYGAAAYVDNLIIRYEDFIRSKLSDWEPHRIVATTKSEFLQGDGSWESQGHVDIVWIPFNPEISLLGDDYISIDQALTVEIIMRGVPHEELSFQWSIRPKVEPKYYLNSDNRKHFVIEPFGLVQNNWYEVSVKINQRISGQVIWNGVQRVKVNPLPKDGRVVVTPAQGEAFQTDFKIEAVDWLVRHEPKKYQFLYEDDNGQWSPLSGYQEANFIITKLPPTIKVAVLIEDNLQSPAKQGSSSVFSRLTDGQERLNQRIDAARADFLAGPPTSATLLQVAETTQLMLASARPVYGAFDGFEGLVLDYLDRVPASFLEQELTTDQSLSLLASSSILSHLTSLRGIDLDSIIRIQKIIWSLLDDSANELQALDHESWLADTVKRNHVMVRQIIQVQDNMLRRLREMFENKELEGMIYGFKNNTVMEATEYLRKIIVKLEKPIGLGLNLGQIVEFGGKDRDVIHMVVHKYGHQDIPKNDTFKFKNVDILIPMAVSTAPTEQQTYTKVTFSANIYYGSNYVIPRKIVNPSTGENFVNMTQQEVFANQSLYISWRDIEGNYLNNSILNGNIEYSLDYFFQKHKFRRDKEVPITHCVYMSPYFEKSQEEEKDKAAQSIEEQMIVKDRFSFGGENCATEIQYELNRIVCKCQHNSFFTVSRDEYYRPFDPVEGNFDFQNWSSFTLFCYLMLVLIVGMMISQNLDQRDMAKLNALGDGDEFLVVTADDEQVTFPLQTFALKRQVQMMNYVDSEREAGRPISKLKLFLLGITNFHHILQFLHRFDPTFSRSDRFLIYFLQLSIVTFASFIMFRNLDKATQATNQYDEFIHGSQGVQQIGVDGTVILKEEPISFAGLFQSGTRFGLTFLTLLIFTLILQPLPNWTTALLRRKFVLQESDDLDQEDDVDDLGEATTAADKAPPSPTSKSAQESNHNKRPSSLSASFQSSMSLDPLHSQLALTPDLPLSLLFQISLMPLPYLKKSKGALKRFPFLATGATGEDVGRALMVTTQTIQKKTKKREIEERKRLEEEQKEKERERRQKRRRKRRRDKRKQKSMDAAPGQQTPAIEVEGGEQENDKDDASSSSIDLDEIEEPTQKDFVQDASQKTQNRCRILVSLFIATLYICLLLIFSVEGMHNSRGHLLWVLAVIISQLLSIFIAEPLYFFMMATYLARIEAKNHETSSQDDSYKLFLAKYFYDYLILIEDWKHVINFQSQRM